MMATTKAATVLLTKVAITRIRKPGITIGTGGTAHRTSKKAVIGLQEQISLAGKKRTVPMRRGLRHLSLIFRALGLVVTLLSITALETGCGHKTKIISLDPHTPSTIKPSIGDSNLSELPPPLSVKSANPLDTLLPTAVLASSAFGPDKASSSQRKPDEESTAPEPINLGGVVNARSDSDGRIRISTGWTAGNECHNYSLKEDTAQTIFSSHSHELRLTHGSSGFIDCRSSNVVRVHLKTGWIGIKTLAHDVGIRPTKVLIRTSSGTITEIGTEYWVVGLPGWVAVIPLKGTVEWRSSTYGPLILAWGGLKKPTGQVNLIPEIKKDEANHKQIWLETPALNRVKWRTVNPYALEAHVDKDFARILRAAGAPDVVAAALKGPIFDAELQVKLEAVPAPDSNCKIAPDSWNSQNFVEIGGKKSTRWFIEPQGLFGDCKFTVHAQPQIRISIDGTYSDWQNLNELAIPQTLTVSWTFVGSLKWLEDLIIEHLKTVFSVIILPVLIIVFKDHPKVVSMLTWLKGQLKDGDDEKKKSGEVTAIKDTGNDPSPEEPKKEKAQRAG